MYCILCTAVDSVIEPLERITEAAPWVAVLRKALLDAEDTYIETAERSVGDTITYGCANGSAQANQCRLPRRCAPRNDTEGVRIECSVEEVQIAASLRSSQ